MTADRAQVAEAPARLRLDHVDGLRAVAALVVYCNHAFAQTWNVVAGEGPTGWLSPTRYGMVAGHLSVTVFIVVSGFCLALPVVPKGELRGGLKNFLQRRARRILPPYYAALALCLGLIYTVIGDWTGTLWDVPIKVKESPGTSILAHVLLLQDLFATSHINYVFWSIAVEWQIYFAMPILVWAWRKYGAGFVVGAALTLGYALMFGFSETRLERANPHYLGMFALGMLAAYVVRSEQPVFARLRERVPWAWLGLSAFLVAAGLVRYWGLGPSTSRFPYLDLPVGVMATALLISTSSAPSSLLERVFSFRPLVFVGTFSYSLYLIHAPLLQLLWQYGLNPLGLRSDALFLVLMTAGLALVLLCSYLFHLAFEAPFMRAASNERGAAPSPLPSR